MLVVLNSECLQQRVVSMLPEEIRKLIGQSFGTSIFEVEKESIRRFADAVGDTSLLYRDAEYAKKSKYGSIIAPPGYISAQWYWGDSHKQDQEPSPEVSGLIDVILALVKAGYQQALDSGIDYEFFQPVRVGDTIKATSVVKDIVERSSGDEKAIFLFTETTYTNQNGEVVAVTRTTSTHR